MRLTEPAQLKALGNPLRTQIVSLLLEREATLSQLADTLERPVGTIGHHMGVLEDAGLVEVVRTRQVRAITEKYYARTARLFVLDSVGEKDESMALAVLDEARAAAWSDPESGLRPQTAIAYSRLPIDRAAEFTARFLDLLDEFREAPKDGDITYAAVVGVVPTRRRPLPPDDDEDAAL